jgi:hypothetical protein
MAAAVTPGPFSALLGFGPTTRTRDLGGGTEPRSLARPVGICTGFYYHFRLSAQFAPPQDGDRVL